MRIKGAIVLLVFTVISVGAWTSMGQAQRGRSVSYEYMVVPDETDSNRDEGLQKLDKLGAQGWEVFAVRSEGPNSGTKLYLKRVKR